MTPTTNKRVPLITFIEKIQKRLLKQSVYYTHISSLVFFLAKKQTKFIDNSQRDSTQFT